MRRDAKFWFTAKVLRSVGSKNNLALETPTKCWCAFQGRPTRSELNKSRSSEERDNHLVASRLFVNI